MAKYIQPTYLTLCFGFCIGMMSMIAKPSPFGIILEPNRNSNQHKSYTIEGTVYRVDLDDQPNPDRNATFKPDTSKYCADLEVKFTGLERSVSAITNKNGFFQMQLTSEDLGGRSTILLSLSKMESPTSGYKGEIKNIVLPSDSNKVRVQGFAWYWFRS